MGSFIFLILLEILIALSYQSTNYFSLFLPRGVPSFIIPIIIFIEVIFSINIIKKKSNYNVIK